MTKEHILAEIRRTAKDGKPLGIDAFFKETGIKNSDWLGKYWARWSEAHLEAGFTPLEFNTTAREETNILEQIVHLTRKLGALPTTPEMNIEKRRNPLFPNSRVISRRWNRSELVSRLIEYCLINSDNHDVEKILSVITLQNKPSSESQLIERTGKPVEDGFVYLEHFQNRHYMIGRTNHLGRRQYEHGKLLPKKMKPIHSIKTDDPVGIEAYWHNRFADKRGNGEWFELSPEDVKAFKRRTFM
jgi:hypothetical protein